MIKKSLVALGDDSPIATYANLIRLPRISFSSADEELGEELASRLEDKQTLLSQRLTEPLANS